MNRDRRSLPPTAEARRRRAVNLAGLCLLVAAIVWTITTAMINGSGPWGHVLMLAGIACSFVIGRWSASWWPSASPIVVAALIAMVSVQLSTRSVLGYANADAALVVQGMAAACLASARLPRRPWGWLAIAGAAALMVPVFATESAAAIGAAAVVLVVGLAAPRIANRWIVAVSCLLPLPLVLLTVLAGHDKTIDFTDHRRRALWSDALELMADSPWTGVGPNRFAMESATALSDTDARWAHSLPLEQAAEQGLPGLVLLALLLGWATVALYTAPSPAAVAVVGAAAVMALGMQAAIDYIAEFPDVTLTCALLLGMATAPQNEQSAFLSHPTHGLPKY
jgi:O-Antigen ligase